MAVTVSTLAPLPRMLASTLAPLPRMLAPTLALLPRMLDALTWCATLLTAARRACRQRRSPGQCSRRTGPCRCTESACTSPNTDPGPFARRVQCSTCANGLPGDPIVTTVTDDKGNFSLEGVPSGADIPVVITIGKWRRQLKIASVASCATQALAATDTRLPASRDGSDPDHHLGRPTADRDLDWPGADSLECLVRRLGIADTEITSDAAAAANNGKIHLFADTKAIRTAPTVSGVGPAASMPPSQVARALQRLADVVGQCHWIRESCNNYDIVILSCEGAQHFETKPQPGDGSPEDVRRSRRSRVPVALAQRLARGCNTSTDPAGRKARGMGRRCQDDVATPRSPRSTQGCRPRKNTSDTIDEINNPKGMSFANWMLNVQRSRQCEIR